MHSMRRIVGALALAGLLLPAAPVLAEDAMQAGSAMAGCPTDQAMAPADSMKSGDAMAPGNAMAGDDAMKSGDAMASGNAMAGGDAMKSGDAMASGNAMKADCPAM